MHYRKKGSLLRKGIATFLLFMMAGSSLVFAVDTVDPADSDGSGQIVESSAEQDIAGEDVVNAAAGEKDETVTETKKVEIEAENEGSEKVIEEIKEDEGVVIFAQGSENTDKTVRLYYNKKVKYEKYRTHDFHVMCDGESIVAYCIEPTKRLGKKKVRTAVPCSSKLLSKALYYSYGNPGYDDRSAAFLNGLKLKACYKGSTGRYAFCHVMLSYIYDGESTQGDAFKGCSSNTKKNVKKFVTAIKSWPDPPDETELAFRAKAFEAEWNEELGMQETPEISVTGTEGNSIDVPVPEKVSIVKGEEIITEGNVRMATGESFKLRAPETVQGQYTSPALTAAMTDFRPYIIKMSGKQDQLFGINSGKTISYTIKWADFGRVEMIKKSSAPDITEGNGYYSLDGAKYGLYSKATDRKYADLVTDADGKAAADNIPYGEYYLKEAEPSRGYELDTVPHRITVASPAQSETVPEKPIVPSVSTDASVAETGEGSATEGGILNIRDRVEYSGVEPGMEYRITGRLMDKSTGREVDETAGEVTFKAEKSAGSLEMDYSLESKGLGGSTVVAFEKLYYGSDLIAAHEDINNKAQSVKIIKEDKGASGQAANGGPDTGDGINLLLPAMALLLSTFAGLVVLIKKDRSLR
ncbi:MAG: VaFE repeat-containing surface-anchored protein [Bacillota bacterium]|nr:VaFE repeat-containing surface-anchored protein [Bacillota bacterium]